MYGKTSFFTTQICKKSSERMKSFMKKKALLKLLLVALFAVSMILMASCSNSSCFVNFDADGGSAVDSVEVKHGATVGTAPNTVKEGYTFGGWYLDNDKWDFEHYAVTKDITLKAKWIKNHTVSFNSDGGSRVSDIIAVDGTKIAEPSAPIKENAEFLGWYVGDVKWNFAENAITEDLTLTAKWHNIYTVKFNSDGAGYIAHQSVKDGALAAKPQNPSRHGYEFAGWFAFNETTHEFVSDKAWDFATPITESLTLKAKWTPIYTVSFSTEGAGKMDSIKLLGGSLIPAPAEITKDGYIFAGWYVGDVLWDFATATVTSDVKLVAKWNAITYTVTLDKNIGEEEPEQLDITVGDKIPAPDPIELQGFAFLGWYVFNTEDETFTDKLWNFETDTVTEEITLKAKWIKTYSVSFIIDGAVDNSFTIHEGSLITLPEESPEKDGCAFVGWYFGTTPWNFATPVTQDVALTAKFLTKHTVKFDLDGAASAAIPDVKLLFGEKITKPADPEKPNYVFEGWYFGDVLWNFDNIITSDVVLTAKWAKMYNVEFKDLDGTFLGSAKVAAGHKIPVPATPTKYLYLFANWQTHDKTVWNFDTDVVSGDTILYTSWTDNYWVISFNTNGAGEMDPVIIERGELITEPERPEKDGEGFVAWCYTSPNGEPGALFDFTKAPTSDTTLIAKWTGEFFTVKFYNGTEIVKIQNVAYSNPYATEIPYTELETPDANSHYIFNGWTDASGKAWDFNDNAVTGDMELHAAWRKVFKITLISDGVVYEIIDAYEGKPAGLVTPPEKRNAVFGGWLDENNNKWDLATKLVTKDETLVAKWLPSATVRYELLGGYFEDSSFLGYETVILKDGEDVFFTEPGAPKKSKYVFGGWFVAGATEPWNFTEDAAVQGEIMLVAKWIPQYYVDFELDGGEGSFPQQIIVENGKVIAPTVAPTKEYMIFDGWYLGNVLYDFTTPVTSDITLTAKWTRIKYNVTFDANGGVGGYTDSFEAGKTITLPTTITRENYFIKEWRLADGSVWNFAEDILLGDMTLKAIWANEDVTISFDLNGGTSAGGTASIPSQKLSYGSLLTAVDTPYMGTPDSEYIFKGWFRPDGTKWDFATDVATESITLTAKWATDYTVSFETDKGVYETKNVASGSLVTPPLIAPVNPGYKFLGWYSGNVLWDFTTMPINEDLVLVAKWEEEVYTVTFVTRVPDSDELVTLGTQQVKYGDFIICPETPFIGENYEFDSWRTTDGQVWSFSSNAVTGDITIQAYWVTYGTGSGGGVNGPWDEATATRGPTHNF